MKNDNGYIVCSLLNALYMAIPVWENKDATKHEICEFYDTPVKKLDK